MNNLTNPAVVNSVINPRYVMLEDKICYDWDDYEVWGCVMFDIIENKIAIHKYGHGTDLAVRNETISLEKAISNNLVTVSTIIDTIVNDFGFSFSKIDFARTCSNYSMENPIDIPVKIVRGRKGKGITGRLIYTVRVPQRYGWGAYHNWYDEKAVVLNPDNGEFITVNSLSYLEFDTEFIENFNNAIIMNITRDTDTVYYLAHIYAYQMSYSSCDRDNYFNAIEKVSRLGFNIIKRGIDNVSEIVRNAVNTHLEAERIKKEAAEKAFKEEKMKDLIKWVMEKTDKKGDEIQELAERIYNKHYGNN